MLHVVTGQTATGKTAYALNLAKKCNGELINADARQLYKNLTIITGKDLHFATGPFQTVKKLAQKTIGFYPLQKDVRLWLYDIVEPDQHFSIYEYQQCVEIAIANITARGKVPILVGGSYFYIQHILYGTVKNTIPPNQQLRTQLKDASVELLQHTLKKINMKLFISLNKSEQHNPQRLIRRIEKELYQSQHLHTIPDSTTTIKHPLIANTITGLQFTSKENLHTAIAERVHKRIALGALDEVKQILQQGYSTKDPGLKTIGYVQIIDYLNNKISYEDMKSTWITKEIQYAKRQLTFMKKNPDITWVSI